WSARPRRSTAVAPAFEVLPLRLARSPTRIDEGPGDLSRLNEPRVADRRVVVSLHVVDQMALDIVDAAVGEDPDIQLRAHGVVVAVLVVRGLLRATDADEHRRY